MKKLFVVIGGSGSGKTTLITELVKRYPNKFKKVVTCTSRARRTGEIDGKDYNYLSQNFFVNNQKLVLVKYSEEEACYGTRKQDLYSGTHHLLLTSKPTGIPKLIQLGFRNIIVLRINIDEKLKIERMKQRGDSEKEISDRLVLDNLATDVDFSEVPVVEIGAEQSLDRKVELVLQVC